MPNTISLDELPGPLRDRLRQAIDEMQTALLVEGSRTVAEVRPLPKAATIAELAQVLAEAPRLSPEDGESFANDIADARRQLSEMPICERPA